LVVEVGKVVIHLRVELPDGMASQKAVVPITIGPDYSYGTLLEWVRNAVGTTLAGCLREIAGAEPDGDD
jgi:hypothetical protein